MLDPALPQGCPAEHPTLVQGQLDPEVGRVKMIERVTQMLGCKHCTLLTVGTALEYLYELPAAC